MIASFSMPAVFWARADANGNAIRVVDFGRILAGAVRAALRLDVCDRQEMARQSKKIEENVGVEDPDDILKHIARRLQEARLEAGLTQSQLGEKAGLKQSYVFELEYGDINPTLKTLEKMAKALDLNLRDLLPGAPGEPPSGSDVKHIMLTMDRLTKVVEEYLLSERQRVEREEQRRAKQETVLLESLRGIAELRHNLRPPGQLGSKVKGSP